MKTSEVHLNRPVAQTFLSAGSRDIPVPCFWLAENGRRESLRNPQAGVSVYRGRTRRAATSSAASSGAKASPKRSGPCEPFRRCTRRGCRSATTATAKQIQPAEIARPSIRGRRSSPIGPGKFSGRFNLFLGQQKFAALFEVVAQVLEIPLESLQRMLRATKSALPSRMLVFFSGWLMTPYSYQRIL